MLVVAQRSLTECKRAVDDAVTSADCDDLTMMTSLKDAHLLTLPCNHVPLRLRCRGPSTSLDLVHCIVLLLLPYTGRLIRLNLPTLKYMRIRGDMVEVYKILTNRYGVDVNLNLQKTAK